MAHEISSSSPIPEVLSPVSEDTKKTTWEQFPLGRGWFSTRVKCAGESVRMLLLGRLLAVAQMLLPLRVPSFPHACPLVLQGDGDLLTQVGSNPVPARDEDGCMLLCAIIKGSFQSELQSKYALVTGQIFSITFQSLLSPKSRGVTHASLGLQLDPVALCSWGS